MKVVDASAIAAIFFNELTREGVQTRLRDELLAAPVLIEFELANVCLKKITSYPHERDATVDAFSSFGQLNVRVCYVGLRETVELALMHRLSAYDASYLWLARELGAELVTLDAKLERAYAAVGPR